MFDACCGCGRVIGTAMTKMIKKSDLPTKVCAACGLPFAWRKKWARHWDEVKYCSDRCRSTKARMH